MSWEPTLDDIERRVDPRPYPRTRDNRLPETRHGAIACGEPVAPALVAPPLRNMNMRRRLAKLILRQLAQAWCGEPGEINDYQGSPCFMVIQNGMRFAVAVIPLPDKEGKHA